MTRCLGNVMAQKRRKQDMCQARPRPHQRPNLEAFDPAGRRMHAHCARTLRVYVLVGLQLIKVRLSSAWLTTALEGMRFWRPLNWRSTLNLVEPDAGASVTRKFSVWGQKKVEPTASNKRGAGRAGRGRRVGAGRGIHRAGAR